MAARGEKFAGGKPLLGGLLVALALAAGWIAARTWRGQLVADQWRHHLAEVGDADAPRLTREAAALGERGIGLLVEALGSRRAAVATAARETLADEMDRWATLPNDEASPKLAALAAALAERVHRFGPVGRGWAADFVARLIQWPTDSEVIDQGKFLADCGAVLEATADARSRPEWDVRRAAAQLDPLRAPRVARDPPDGADTELARVLEATHLPGGGLPIEPAQVRRFPPRRLSDGGEPGPFLASPGEIEPLPSGLAPPPPTRMSQADSKVVPLAGGDASAKEPADDGAEFKELETPALIRRLASDDSEEIRRVEEELMRRGMNAVHLRLAHRLTDPDPRARRALVDQLPKLTGIDARPWLLWLAEDPAADVRLAALTVLATSNAPALLDRIARQARGDADPRVRALADRLLAPRRAD